MKLINYVSLRKARSSNRVISWKHPLLKPQSCDRLFVLLCAGSKKGYTKTMLSSVMVCIEAGQMYWWVSFTTGENSSLSRGLRRGKLQLHALCSTTEFSGATRSYKCTVSRLVERISHHSFISVLGRLSPIFPSCVVSLNHTLCGIRSYFLLFESMLWKHLSSDIYWL